MCQALFRLCKMKISRIWSLSFKRCKNSSKRPITNKQNEHDECCDKAITKGVQNRMVTVHVISATRKGIKGRNLTFLQYSLRTKYFDNITSLGLHDSARVDSF